MIDSLIKDAQSIDHSNSYINTHTDSEIVKRKGFGMEIMRLRLSLGDRLLDKIRIKDRRLFESVYKYTH